MSLKPILAFRPGTMYPRDSMIIDWISFVRMFLQCPRPFSNFFIKSTARTIDHEQLRLKNWAFHPTGSLLQDVTLLFGRTGVVTHLDSDVINHKNNLNKVGMDLDIFTSRYTINSHVVMIFLVIDQFTAAAIASV